MSVVVVTKRHVGFSAKMSVVHSTKCGVPSRERLENRVNEGRRERSPRYQKLRARDTHIWGIRRSQPNRSAMERPRPGGTAFLITVAPTPGKYEASSDLLPTRTTKADKNVARTKFSFTQQFQFSR